MDNPLGSPAGSRAPSSTPATPLEEHFDQQAQLHPASVSAGSVGTAGPANEDERAGDGASETHEGDSQPTQQSASGPDASQQHEGRPLKRIKKEFGGERWTKEEELALLEIRQGHAGATWEGTPEKLVAKGFAKRSVKALKQRWQAMDGSGENPRPITETNNWTDDERLALLAIVTHRDPSVLGLRKHIDWSSWQPLFPGKTRYQLQQKGAELRKLEESTKLKDEQRQTDRTAREAAIEAKWRSLQAMKAGSGQANAGAGPSTATSAADDTSQTLDEIIAACSATGPAATTAPSSVGNRQMQTDSDAWHSFVQTPSAQPFFHAASFSQLDSFLPPQQTTASSRPSTLHYPTSFQMSAQSDAYLDFAIDAAINTPVPPSQNTQPLHPPNHTTLGQSTSAQRLQQSAFPPREQQHQPVAVAAVVPPALPTKQPVVAAEIAKLIVDATGQTAKQPPAVPVPKPAEDKEAEKREEPMWRTDLGDEEDTSWVPKSKAGLKLEEKLRGIARRLRE